MQRLRRTLLAASFLCCLLSCTQIPSKGNDQPFVILSDDLSQAALSSILKSRSMPEAKVEKMTQAEGRASANEIKKAKLTIKMANEPEGALRVATVQSALAARRYNLQLVGFSTGSGEYVLVNAVSNDSLYSGWQKSYLFVMDGGTSTWYGLWNRRSKQFEFISINRN